MYSHLVKSPNRPPTIRIGYLPSPRYLNSAFFGWSKDMQPSHHAMNPSYVGKEMAYEIAETYYKENDFWTTTEQYLPKLLFTDYHGIGIKPYEHVRQIRLCIKINGGGNTPDEELARLDDAHTHLRNLCLITHKNSFSIYINLTTFYDPLDHSDQSGDPPMLYAIDDERRMFNVLEMFRQPVYELLHAGSQVTILHSNRKWWNADDQSEDDPDTGYRTLTKYGRFRGDVTVAENNFFCMNKEIWDRVRLSRHARCPSHPSLTNT
jgi:hypothetical protein